MKKALCVLASIVFLSGLVAAQSITITWPKSGCNWQIGSSKTITWTFKGIPDGTPVFLKLFQGSDPKGDLVGSTSIGANGKGSWTWNSVGQFIGGKAVAGDNYKIRIRDLGSKCPLEVSEPFSLKAAGKEFENISMLSVTSKFQVVGDGISVSQPAQGLQLHAGEALYIKWDKGPIASYPQVKFGVYSSDHKTFIGSIHIPDMGLKPNTGVYNDAIILPARYQVGNDYVIRVATPDEKFVGFSGVFHIIPVDWVWLTETFTAGYPLSYLATGESNWIGCMNTLGQAPSVPAVGFPVGWENWNDDPAGPCWSYVGQVYRTLFNPSEIYEGWEVSKAELKFSVINGVKQTFYILIRKSNSNNLSAPTEMQAAVNWDFGSPVVVDVTATVQAWCTGKMPNYGWIIRGANENYDHDNTKALCAITLPELIVTKKSHK